MPVLIVDDDEIALELLGEAVWHGYEVTAAHNGREALEILPTGLSPLVISDWEMPEMKTASSCADRYRPAATPSYVYIILVTSRDGHRQRGGRVSTREPTIHLRALSIRAELRVRVKSGSPKLLSLERPQT